MIVTPFEGGILVVDKIMFGVDTGRACFFVAAE